MHPVVGKVLIDDRATSLAYARIPHDDLIVTHRTAGSTNIAHTD